jgi:hypothetical protein
MKIGRTNDVLKRRQDVKTGTPGELIIMALEPGSAAIEQQRHEQFGEGGIAADVVARSSHPRE